MGKGPSQSRFEGVWKARPGTKPRILTEYSGLLGLHNSLLANAMPSAEPIGVHLCSS